MYLDNTEKTPDTESCTIIFPDGTEYEYCIPILKVQKYTPEMMEEKRLNILFPFSPIRFRRRFEAILMEKADPNKLEKARKKMEALKKDLTKFMSDCIIIINREEENGTLGNVTGADIVELMGKSCDHLFNKDPNLLREVHEVMEPAIKLFSEKLNEQKDAEFKLLSEKLNEQKNTELKLLSEKLNEQKDAEFKLLCEKLNEQKDAEIKHVYEQSDIQLNQHIRNCILQCKTEGKNKSQTEQILQLIFSLKATDAKERLEKYW